MVQYSQWVDELAILNSRSKWYEDFNNIPAGYVNLNNCADRVEGLRGTGINTLLIDDLETVVRDMQNYHAPQAEEEGESVNAQVLMQNRSIYEEDTLKQIVETLGYNLATYLFINAITGVTPNSETVRNLLVEQKVITRRTTRVGTLIRKMGQSTQGINGHVFKVSISRSSGIIASFYITRQFKDFLFGGE